MTQTTDGRDLRLDHETKRQASDSQLIEEVRQGDRSAYGELVQRYEKKLLRTIYRMVGDAHIAEDIAQDTFLKAYDRLDRFDNSKRFGPWLFQIGVNASIDWLRRYRRRHQISLSEMTKGEGEFDLADEDARPKQELAQEVRFVLDKVPMKYRTVLMLRDLEGFPCSEIAAIIDRSEPTVRWRLLKARKMFRVQWQRRERQKP